MVRRRVGDHRARRGHVPAPCGWLVHTNMSGPARDLTPGPHGPEIVAVSSTEHFFEGFELISGTNRPTSSPFHPPTSPGLLHELLQGLSLVTAPASVHRPGFGQSAG